jgi:ribosomal protein L7/L12
MGWLSGSPAEEPGDAARLAAIERKLQAILDHLGIVDVEPTYPQVLELARRGHKIAAIKLYREQTGAGLADAKHAVERMERGL